MIRLKARILVCRIEYHWWMVRLYRQVMGLLYILENNLSSRWMLWLNKKLSRHALFIVKAERYYEEQFFPIVGGVL